MGYSKEFIENMQEVIACLKTNPAVKLSCEYDAICKKCPNMKNSRCGKYQRDLEPFVREMDLKLLWTMNLKANTELPARQAFALLKKHVKKADLLETCRDCEFLELGCCIEGL